MSHGTSARALGKRGGISYQQIGPGQQVELVSIGFALPIADLYVNTDVPERESEEE